MDKLLENSYRMTCDDLGEMSRYEYLADHIFDFTTYDSEISYLFGRKALEVCVAINNGQIFEYHEKMANDYQWYIDNYHWYIIMVNMPFFTDKLQWGTSIRGAWWDSCNGIKLKSCGIFKDREQILELKFTKEEWSEFIKEMEEFANGQDL